MRKLKKQEGGIIVIEETREVVSQTQVSIANLDSQIANHEAIIADLQGMKTAIQDFIDSNEQETEYDG